ncbi:MAG: trypsin-like peptidase domain-containing protein [Ignavibacteria bacterium]|nr:trypsin-like peptidase domain-containing protein [Ignavibacteria bacterium]
MRYILRLFRFGSDIVSRSFIKIIITVFLLIAAFTDTALTQEEVTHHFKEKKNDDLNAGEIIEKFKPALISIWFHDRNYYSYTSFRYIDTTVLSGSGFIFGEDGLIGTNYHVTENIDSLIVKTSDGMFYGAELILSDEINDFAILKLINPDNKKFPVVKLGNSDNVKAGTEVYAIGSPLGYEYTISSGIVAAVRENEKVSFTDPVTYESVEKQYEKVIQITAAISPGNSGGALFNTKGEVIGVTTFTYTGYGNLNFAVAINTFRKLSALEETKNYINDSAILVKKEENLFNTNLKLARDLKSQVTYDWSYSRLKDTMKMTDTFIVKQDSVNRSRLQTAEKYFQKCISMKPDSFAVYQELLDMYVLTDNFSKAENLYKDIRYRFDSDSLLNLLSSNLAEAYSTSKEYGKAIQFYEKMLKQDNTLYFIYYQIAGIYEKTGDYKSAVKEYNKLLALDSNYNEANLQLGKIYFNEFRNYKKAKKYLQRAYENELLQKGSIQFNSIDLQYLMGKIAVIEGRKLDAIMSYLELRDVYVYDTKDNEKKLDLYKEIMNMEE